MSTSSCFHPSIAFTLLFGLFAGMASSSSFASGAIGGGTGIGPGPQRPVDERYEYGKAVYLGRLPNAEKIEFCLVVDGEAKKLKRRSLKPYRGKSKTELANALFRCEDTSKLALRAIEREQIAFVLYYLNKRFKLKLSDA